MTKPGASQTPAIVARLLSWQGLATILFVTGFVYLVWRTSSNWVFIQCLLVALPIMALYALPFWWIDRLPRFGLKWTATALGWGAFVAACSALMVAQFTTVFISYIVITYLNWTPEDAQNMSSLFTAILSTPIMEEFAKGSLILLMLWHPKRLVTGAWHGAWLTAVVCIGFGWSENAILASDVLRHGTSPWDIFWGRSHLPVLHIGMSLPIGIAIGLASRIPSLSQRMAVILAGWLLSMLIHATWNWYGMFRTEESSVWVSSAFFSFVIIFLMMGVLALLYFMERRSINHYLSAPGIPIFPDPKSNSEIRLAQLKRLAQHLPPDDFESREKARLEASLYTDDAIAPSMG